MATSSAINQAFAMFQTTKATSAGPKVKAPKGRLSLPADLQDQLSFQRLFGFIQSIPKLDPTTVEGQRLIILKKWCNDRYVTPDSNNAASLRDNAFNLMRESEQACEEYNYSSQRPSIFVMARARELIYRILGELNFGEIFKTPMFSPGASVGFTRLEAHPVNKYTGEITVTPACEPLLRALITTIPRWDVEGAQFRFRLVPGNKVTTVPKDAEKDRAIAIEPSGNMYMQLAVGTYIKRVFSKHTGISLSDQSLNRFLARAGSYTTLLSTIDLKRASDSISTRIVEELLPSDWYRLLSRLRSPVGTIDNITHFKWEKFSSMGNGFTFELESLIFYCLAVAAMQCSLGTPGVSVHGDDLIIPTRHYNNITSVLTECGFTINDKKSCSTGFFRESCGGFYYKGSSVWPIRPKGPIDTLPKLLVLLNQISRWSQCEHTGMVLPYFLPYVKKIYRLMPWLTAFRGSLDDGAGAIRSSGVNRLYLSPVKPKSSRKTKFNQVGTGGFLSWLQKKDDLYHNGSSKPYGTGGDGAYVIKRRCPSELQWLRVRYDLIDNY